MKDFIYNARFLAAVGVAAVADCFLGAGHALAAASRKVARR